MQTVVIVMGVVVAGLLVAVGILARQVRLGRRRQRELSRRLAVVESTGLRAARLAAKHEGERALAGAGGVARLPLRFTAEWGEDVFLAELFEFATRGVYIEAGAFDGVTLAVTYPFEAMGWTGLLVEALPEQAERCRASRPGSRVVQAALGAPGGPGTVSFMSVGPASDATAQMLSHAGTNDEHRRLLRERGDTRREVRVPMVTLASLLEDAGGLGGAAAGSVIDFAVFDVEGGELDLLRGLDLSRHRPRVMVVEDLSRGEDDAVGTFVRAAGYAQVGRIGRNVVFVRADEGALAARARGLLGVLT